MGEGISPPAARTRQPEAVVSVSFDGPPDGSEDHHRGPQQRCARPSTRFPAVQCGGRRRAVPGSRRAGASATESFAGRPLDTPELLLRHPARDRAPRRERFRYAGLLPGRAARASSSGRQPLPPVFGAPGRPRPPRRRSTDPVRRRAALHAQRGSFVRGFPGNGSREPFERRAPYAGHHGVTTGFCLAPRAATGPEADFAPRHYRIPPGISGDCPATRLSCHGRQVVTGRRRPPVTHRPRTQSDVQPPTNFPNRDEHSEPASPASWPPVTRSSLSSRTTPRVPASNVLNERRLAPHR